MAFAQQAALTFGAAFLGGAGAGVGLAALAGGGMAGGGLVPFVLFGLNVLGHGESAQEQGGGKGGNACGRGGGSQKMGWAWHGALSVQAWG